MAEEFVKNLHTNPILSEIKIGGQVYDIHDKIAGEQIDLLKQEVKGGVHYLGKTYDPITDRGAEAVVIGDTIYRAQVTGQLPADRPEVIQEKALEKGDMVIYMPSENDPGVEFIWSGAYWDKFGSRDAVLGELGDLAFEDQVEGQLDWTHSHNFELEDATVNVSGATAGVAVDDHTFLAEGSIVITNTTSSDVNYTPAGDVTLGGLEAKSVTMSGNTAETDLGSINYKPEGDITVTTGAPVGDEVANYTPAGTINKLSFTGKQASLTHAAHGHNLTGAVEVDVDLNLDKIPVGEKTHKVNVTGAEYTPAGTVAISGGALTNTLALNPTNTTKDVAVTDAAAQTDATDAVRAEVNGTTLELTRLDLKLEVLNAVALEGGVSLSPISGSFSGTKATITPAVTVDPHAAYELTPSGSADATVRNTLAIADATVAAHIYTPEGTITDPVFTGTGIVIKAAFAGKQASLALGKHKHAAGALAGSVQVPTTATFAGEQVGFAFAADEMTLKHTVTQGTVSASGTYKKLKSINNAGQNSNIICK